mmetsp:Transcript_13196/g.22445  ORF Transcript_13196/g.22445 Transcript_13196/m.22445 type:complete len:120 (-) Transcript_13196:198-557(-)
MILLSFLTSCPLIARKEEARIVVDTSSSRKEGIEESASLYCAQRDKHGDLVVKINPLLSETFHESSNVGYMVLGELDQLSKNLTLSRLFCQVCSSPLHRMTPTTHTSPVAWSVTLYHID